MTHSTTNTAARELLELIDRYWDLAYAEGKEGRTHDTEAGDAQQCRHEIESRIATLPQQQGGEQETVGEGCGLCGGFCNHPEEHTPPRHPADEGVTFSVTITDGGWTGSLEEWQARRKPTIGEQLDAALAGSP